MANDINAFINIWHTPQINNKYLGESDCEIEQVGYDLYLYIHPRILTLGIFFLLTSTGHLLLFFS